MKAIILVALFAFTVQAALQDTRSYTLGFANQLGMDSNGISSGIECFTSLNETIEQLSETIAAVHWGAEDLTLSAFNLIALVDGPLKTDCQTYATDLISFIIQKTNVTSEEDVELVISKNAKAYAPQLIQLVTQWIDSVLAGNAYHAGSFEALIFQVLLGIQAPVQITSPRFNYSDYVSMNASKYIIEYYSAFFNALNAEDSSAAYLQCYNSGDTAIPIVQNFIRNFEQADDIIDKVEILRTTVDDLSFFIEDCTPVIEANLELYAPIYEAIREDPLETIITIIHNIASNLPEIEQDNINQSADIFTGNYAKAGETYAAILLTIFANAGY